MTPSGPMARAVAAWGDDLPDWIVDLARECEATSQNKVAARMDLSAALISQVLGRKYPGDLAGVEDQFNGVFKDAVVTCPALGELPTHECRMWRDRSRTFVSVNSQRVQMFRACNACPRNRRDVA